MKHFLGVQNGSIFVSFLCIFTNFFLVLLRKKAFLRLLLCIFSNRQKMQATDQTLRTGQYTGSSIQTACEQHTQTSISSGKKQVFLQLPTSFHLASLQSPTSSDRQVNFSRRQPANISRRNSAFLTEQISASRHSATFIFTNLFHPPTSSLFFRNLPQKKLSLRLSFSRCI